MVKIKLFAICAITLIAASVLFLHFPFVIDRSSEEIFDITREEASSPLEEIVPVKIPEKQVGEPLSLKIEKEVSESSLTQSGVIQWTNAQRAKYGLPHLKQNSKLNSSALIKLNDMFENEYFAHDSILGLGAGDLAKAAEYEFIVIGENLALGNFENDQVLVQAWMDSPGHRANILGENYIEIGVAVGKGIFNGRNTWLAVQHFALPLSSCPQPDESIKAELEKNKDELEKLSADLEVLQSEIQKINPRRNWISYDKNAEAYEEKVEEYNNIVSRYNFLSEENKTLAIRYNSQVQAFNNCIGEI